MSERQNLAVIPVLKFTARTCFGVLLLAFAAAPVAFAATPTANRAAPSATPVPHAPRPATPSGHETPPARDPTAPAEPTRPDSDVEAHVALGHRLSQIGRYEDAIDEFRRAYELRAEPRFLHEIAEIYRRLGATDQARFYYERYLASAPEAPDRPEVEAKLAALKGNHPPGPARPRLIPEASVAVPPPPPPRAARPWRRWWFWTAIGVAVGAGATAIALSGRSETAVPTTALGDQKFFQ
jgi:tetratricopeptide (TPR) repeat protein